MGIQLAIAIATELGLPWQVLYWLGTLTAEWETELTFVHPGSEAAGRPLSLETSYLTLTIEWILEKLVAMYLKTIHMFSFTKLQPSRF